MTPRPQHRTRDTSATVSAAEFVERLEAHRSAEELEKIQRYFKSGEGEYGQGDVFMGVRMGQVFALADEFKEMSPAEIEKLLESPTHEVRAGGVKIMAKQAASKKTADSRRKELFDLYLRRHDRINNWDLVDLGAWDVIGRYLVDQPCDVLYQLARSANVWERRTAILSTMAFVRRGDLDDAFTIAGLLLNDDHDLIHKAVGWALRAAGGTDRQRLVRFLDAHAATMPRTALRNALEHFDKDSRDHYLNMRKAAGRG
jgi:3-methyladenine DNA glycosylase AlkD